MEISEGMLTSCEELGNFHQNGWAPV